MNLSDVSPELIQQLFIPGRTDTYVQMEPRRTGIKQPVTSQVLQDHLAGTRRVAVYLLNPDSLTYFAVLDFDDGGIGPVKEIARIALSWGLTLAIEPSRSKGYHGWLFFQEPVPAVKPRAIFHALITRSGWTKHKIELHPDRDQLSDGGFDRAMTLPWYGLAVSENRGVFLDLTKEHWPPFPDQAAYVQSLPRLTEADLDTIIDKQKITVAVAAPSRQPLEPVEKQPAARPYPMPPCLSHAYERGWRKGNLRTLAHLLGRRFYHAKLPENATVVLIEEWNTRNEAPGLRSDEIREAVASAYAKGYQSIGCDQLDPELREYCGEHCVGVRAEQKKDRPAFSEDVFSQLSAAHQFLTVHGDDFLWCADLKGYQYWDGARWKSDRRQVIYHHADRWARQVFEDASHMPASTKEDIARRTGWLKFALQLQSRKYLQAVLEFTQPHIAVTPDDFDTNPWLFTVGNGTLDLRSGILRPHDRKDRILKRSRVAYDADAECPRFLEFLSRIMGRKEELVAYLKRLCGYMLSGDISEEVFIIFFGPTWTGKSTFLRILRRVYGDYGMAGAPDLFIEREYEPHPAQYADLYRARFVAVSETKKTHRLNVSKIKLHTGRDRIKARHMFKDFFEFEATYTVVFATNYRPRIVESDSAIWRRIVLVPFTVTIPKNERDPHLDRKILRAEAPGILRWMVEGCLDWQQIGLNPPKVVTDAVKAYLHDEDNVARFLDTICETTGEVFHKDLFERYKTWALAEREVAVGRKTLANALREKGFVDSHLEEGLRWNGLSLLPEKKAPETSEGGGSGNGEQTIESNDG